MDGAAAPPPLERVDVRPREDLFGDEGVLKTRLVDGVGFRHPKEGDDVQLSLKVSTSDGGVTIDERADVRYTLCSASGASSEPLGVLGRTVEKALCGMKRGEKASLSCKSAYAYGALRPEDVSLELSLGWIYELRDVSLAKDGSLLKKPISDGESWETPSEASKVEITVETVTDAAGVAIPGFSGPLALEFAVGNGEVCDALECAVANMRKGERALVTSTNSMLWRDTRLGLDALQADHISVVVRLQDFSDCQAPSAMSEGEKIEFAQQRKDVGASLIKQGRPAMALERYKKVTDIFDHACVDSFKVLNRLRALELQRTCELNKAACFLKLGDFLGAKSSCDTVLKEDGTNVKALFRRATAHSERMENQEAMQDLARVLLIEPENSEAKQLLARVKRAQKEEDKRSQSMYAKMCIDGKENASTANQKTEGRRPSTEDAGKSDATGAAHAPSSAGSTSWSISAMHAAHGHAKAGRPPKDPNKPQHPGDIAFFFPKPPIPVGGEGKEAAPKRCPVTGKEGDCEVEDM